MRTKFEEQILSSEGIPFNVAADFFVGIRQPVLDGSKTASMSDAPDETGELEGMFEVSPEQVCGLIQNVITKAATLQSAALLYSGSIRSPLKPVFMEWDYTHLIKNMSARAAVLAGPVHLGEIEPPPATTDPRSAVRAMIRGEQELIHALRELKTVCGENPMSFMASQEMRSAQCRMDDFWRYLEPEAPQMPGVTEPRGLMEHEADETPEEAEQESPEFEAAEEAAGTEAHEEPKTASSRTLEKRASALFRQAFKKLAEGEMGMTQEAPMSAPSDTRQLEPANYLQAELMGRQAQEQNESGYYKQQLQSASQTLQQMQQQMEAANQQLMQVQQQAEMSGQQIQQATQQAVQANDEALRQTQIAANMRMGMQQMRAQMMEIASQDPTQSAAQQVQTPPGAEQQMAAGGEEAGPGGQLINELAQQPGQAGEQARQAQRADMNAEEQTVQAEATAANQGAAAQSPMGAVAPNGTNGPGGSGMAMQNSAGAPGMDPMTAEPEGFAGVKTSADPVNIAAGAAIGVGLGYAYHKHLAAEADRMRANMSSESPTTFMGAMRQALQQRTIDSAERAKNFPTQSALMHTARGALAGGVAGASSIENVRHMLNPKNSQV